MNDIPASSSHSSASAARALGLGEEALLLLARIDEIQAAVNGLSPQSILAHVRRLPPRDFTIVTLGPKVLEAN